MAKRKPKKLKLTEEVSYQQLQAAVRKWHMIMGHSPQYFQTFLGRGGTLPIYGNGPNIVCKCTPSAQRKILMLASPHADTLFKMFVIRTGYKGAPWK
jgi:hypothetical protein